MSKFTTKTSTKTVNKAGGEAYKQSDKLAFVSLLLASFLKNQYYRSGEDSQKELVNLYRGLPDKLFAAKAALYARNEFGMRSVSHVVAGEVAASVKGEQWTKRFFDKIVRRPDDMMEILGYYKSAHDDKEPNSLKKGFASALQRMDDYKLAKYKYEGKSISLVDVVNLVHPKHTESIGKLIRGKLKPAETWETKLTASKGDEKKKEKAWTDLIKEKKIGYFALLRNLRNILNQAPEIIDAACELLVDEKLIKKSLVLPFRFVTAYEQLKQENGAGKVLGAISKALDISFANVPKFDGKTLVVVDHSGSMGDGYESNFMKGAIFGIAMAKANDADFMHFGSRAEYLSFNPQDSTLSIAQALDRLNKNSYGWGGSPNSKGEVGHGTNFHNIFRVADKAYDRVMIFSDMQGWEEFTTPGGDLEMYKNNHHCNPLIYDIDLAGYGDMQFPEQSVVCLAGWSEKIFDLMKFAETDKQALIKTIEKVEI